MRRVVLVLIVCAGCSDGSVDTQRTAIVGGQPSPSSEDAVVLLLTEMNGSSGLYVENCTAALIAPNLVITARHCISQMQSGTFQCEADGGVTGSGGMYGADAVPASSLVFVGATAPATFSPVTAQAHGVKYFHGSEPTVCNDDVALVEITPPLTAPIVPLAFDDAVTQGELLTVVGWGATEDADLPGTRMERTGVSVVQVGPGYAEPGGAVGSSEFIASESVCSGDSGGPAFDSRGNLVGTVSRGPVNSTLPFGQGCIGTQHTFMQVAPFQDLITTALVASGDPVPTVDAGTPDASDGDAGNPPPAPSSGGCNASAPNGPSVALLAPLVWVLSRRRRVRA